MRTVVIPAASALTLGLALVAPPSPALGGQPPFAAAAPDAPVGGRDRVYLAEQFSNTVSVVDPSRGRLLGAIRLGDPQPANLSPLYRGQVLVHGLGFSPDRKTLAVVSIGSNSVTFVDTATNAVLGTTYVGRSPHEAFFTPDGREVWVSVRGESHVAVLDAATRREKRRIEVPDGPGMTIFSPDGRYGYVCSSFSPETVVVDAKTYGIVGRVRQESPFCPNIAATPEGDEVWLTLKDVGKVMVFDARPPFAVRKVLETGPITNHVNFARTGRGRFAYVTVGGLNEVQVYRADASYERVATVPVGDLPHGLWPSGDGSRVYVGLENGDAVAAIDTATNRVVAEVPVGQAPQAVVYVPGAAPEGPPDGEGHLTPPDRVGSVASLELGAPGGGTLTRVALFDQGLTQVLQAAVTGLAPGRRHALLLVGPGGSQPLATFKTNPAGAAVVNAVGPIRQLVRPEEAGGDPERRRLAIAAVDDGGRLGPVLQVQRGEPGVPGTAASP